VGKIWGLGTKKFMCILFRFLACALRVGSTVGAQNFGRGRYSLPEIFGKTTPEQTTGTSASVRYTRACGYVTAGSDLLPTVWQHSQWPKLAVAAAAAAA